MSTTAGTLLSPAGIARTIGSPRRSVWSWSRSQARNAASLGDGWLGGPLWAAASGRYDEAILPVQPSKAGFGLFSNAGMELAACCRDKRDLRVYLRAEDHVLDLHRIASSAGAHAWAIGEGGNAHLVEAVNVTPHAGYWDGRGGGCRTKNGSVERVMASMSGAGFLGSASNAGR